MTDQKSRSKWINNPSGLAAIIWVLDVLHSYLPKAWTNTLQETQSLPFALSKPLLFKPMRRKINAFLISSFDEKSEFFVVTWSDRQVKTKTPQQNLCQYSEKIISIYGNSQSAHIKHVKLWPDGDRSQWGNLNNTYMICFLGKRFSFFLFYWLFTTATQFFLIQNINWQTDWPVHVANSLSARPNTIVDWRLRA